MRLISWLLDTVCYPVARRLDRQLQPRFNALHDELDRIKAETNDIFRHTYRPIATQRHYSEMDAIGSLPYLLFSNCPGPVGICGVHAATIAPNIPRSVVFCGEKWVKDRGNSTDAMSLHSLLLLDEYAFLDTLYTRILTRTHVQERIIFPVRNHLLPENGYRTLLHQLGFIEVFRVTANPVTGVLCFSVFSHATPVSGAPFFLSGQPNEPEAWPMWLVAVRTATIERRDQL